MSVQTQWRAHLQENKRFFTIAAVALIFLEIQFFAMAALKSGPQTHLYVLDQQGAVVYLVKGNHLDSVDKAKFEQIFGPLSNYRVNLVTQDRPFPIRAWLAAAVGLPIGAVLLFGFIIKAYEALFISTDKTPITHGRPGKPHTGKRDTISARLGRFNIFTLGAVVVLMALGLWALPHMVAELGRNSIEFIARYKGVVLAAIFIFLSIAIWIIYLRYRLAGKAIESQTEVEKYRIRLERLGHGEIPDVAYLEQTANADRTARQNCITAAFSEETDSTDKNKP